MDKEESKEPIFIECNHCGTVNNLELKLCRNCGYPLPTAYLEENDEVTNAFKKSILDKAKGLFR